MSLWICKKQCRSLSRAHKFQKRSTKKLTICRIKLDVKNKKFGLPQLQSYLISRILISTKFKNRNLSKVIDNLVFPISCLGHFFHAFGIVVSNMKKFSICFLLFICLSAWKKNQNRTYIYFFLRYLWLNTSVTWLENINIIGGLITF